MNNAELTIPDGMVNDFMRAIAKRNAELISDYGVETQEKQAHRLYPFLTTEDLFYLCCGLLSKNVAAKAAKLGCDGLSAQFLKGFVEERVGNWIVHVECDPEELGWRG